MRSEGSNTRPSPGPGGAGEGGEERPARPQQPAGEQGDAAGGRTLPHVGRALRQTAAGQRSTLKTFKVFHWCSSIHMSIVYLCICLSLYLAS